MQHRLEIYHLHCFWGKAFCEKSQPEPAELWGTQTPGLIVTSIFADVHLPSKKRLHGKSLTLRYTQLHDHPKWQLDGLASTLQAA